MESEEIEMAPFLEVGAGKYWLRSVVAHHGNTLRQGHYTNFSFNKEKGLFSFFLLLLLLFLLSPPPFYSSSFSSPPLLCLIDQYFFNRGLVSFQ